MSDNVRRDNRRALPKYLLTILLFGLLGGVLGFFTGVAGAAGVAETVRQALDRVLAVCAPWGIVGSAVGRAGTSMPPPNGALPPGMGRTRTPWTRRSSS